MELKQQKSKKIELKPLPRGKNNIVLGSIVATLIAITPYLYNLHESVPDVQVWNTFLFTYDSTYFESTFVLAWTLANKIIPFFLLLIWFFTCRHWWYHTLLVPLAMYVYQIFSVLNEDLSFADDNSLIYLIPIMAIVIPSIYLIRARIFNKVNDADKSMQELEDELKLSPKSFWGKISQYF